MKHIKVLGTGCANCKATIEMIRNQAEAAGIDITLEKVEDMAVIVAAGILSTPGVLLNDKVVH
ncbi:MAG: thioredoxin family protein, partial [Mariprofundaceae bacterium]|nr:thioredoxin family protein [Mariprofundaceae bacterium]